MAINRKRVVVTAIVLVVIGLIGFRWLWWRLETNLTSLVAMELADLDLTTIQDGTYTGSYAMFPVEAVVEVTVHNYEITLVKIVKHNNGKGQSAEMVADRVVEAQSLQVDSVSGSTYSSRVILKAIENALLQQDN
jgi:uncharacterized protein with FMN-binding domain